MTNKSKIIDEIFKVTGLSPEKYFDKLSDHKEEYLVKLLEIAKLLK